MEKRNLLFVILIITSLFLLITPKSVIGSIDDIFYTFNDNLLYSNSSINNGFEVDYNLRNMTEYTEIYNASYSFTNDTDYDNPSNFVITEAGGSVNVIPSLSGHDKVLELNDTGANICTATNTFSSSQVSGSIEWWVRTNNAQLRTPILIRNAINEYVGMNIDDDVFKYSNNVGAWISTGVTALDNTWYHIKIDFETSAGGYKGLAEDKYYLTINGIQYGAYDTYVTNAVIDFRIYSNGADANYKQYYDAIDYSWDTSYSEGRNIIPIVETSTELKEVDKFEFALDDVNTWHNNGDDDLNGWTDYEDPVGDRAYSTDEDDGSFDREYLTTSSAIGNGQGIEKTFNIPSVLFMNITVSVQFISLEGIVNIALIEIDEFDGSDMSIIRFQADLDIEYKDATGYHQCDTDITITHRYDFNFFLDFEIQRVFLRIIESDVHGANPVLVEVRDYTMIGAGSKEGLQDIKIWTLNIENNLIVMLIDYVGVYDYGASQVAIGEDFGVASVDLGNVAWNFENNNLFTLIGNGTFDIGGIDGVYDDGSTLHQIDIFDIYNNIEYLFNIYDDYISSLTLPSLLITVKGNYFNFSSAIIDGVILREGVNIYNLEFESGGVDTSESYFYVDIDNKLQFTLITNDTNTEYIQATFDINNVDSSDKAISFRSFRLSKAYGYFYVDYLVGSSQVEIPIIEKTTRAILPLNKTIDSFIVLISDNDQDIILGTTTGYVSQPILLNVLGISLPIITAGLIEMMIPLLMILIPTLLISKGFGDEGKKLLIPLFLVFSLVTTATLIIPIWIFFIIAFGTALFLFRNKEIEVI